MIFYEVKRAEGYCLNSIPTFTNSLLNIVVPAFEVVCAGC